MKIPRPRDNIYGMKGLILTNAYTLLPQVEHQCARMQEEFSRLSVQTRVMRNNFFAAYLDEGEIRSKISDFDFCLYLDKDKYISHMAERAGVRLFNKAAAIEACDDKMTTALTLANHGIPMPKTLPGMLCYDPAARPDISALKEAGEQLGYPVVIKSCYGSMGKGVFLAENADELIRAAQDLICTPHLFQSFVPQSRGRDLRVIVIGGKTLCCMERRSDRDFRANIAAGGKGAQTPLPREAAELAEKAARLLELDYCGVDLLFGKDGFLLCEVNSNAFFTGMEQVSGVNVAKAYAEHIVNSLAK